MKVGARGRRVVGQLVEADQAVTLAGTTVLRFDPDGLVVDHVDYWMQK